jgi:hypothetical protein
VVGSIVRILYLIIEHGESFRFISLVTAITSAVIILGFSKGVVRWLDEATPWWSQFLIGFSIGFLGQVLLKEIVEEVS